MERSRPLVNDGAWYLQTTDNVIKKDGDKYITLDVLTKQVGILGIFSDWLRLLPITQIVCNSNNLNLNSHRIKNSSSFINIKNNCLQTIRSIITNRYQIIITLQPENFSYQIRQGLS